jgi:isopentenyl-diphosphate delta-isomerase
MSDLGQRKSDHLDLTIRGDVGFRRTTLLEQVQLVHCSLPELSVEEIDQSVQLLGKRVSAPVMIASMTGGNERAERINHQLAEVAERCGVAIGLGSQRPMVKRGTIDPDVARSYQIRHIAPSVPVFGNVGIVQVKAMEVDFVEQMIGAVSADALCVHLNPAQEIIQADGDRDFRGGLEALQRLEEELSVPVIVKETGCGLSRRTADALRQIGILHVDVSGAGGTSWVGVETRRAKDDREKLGELYWDWGIPTAGSLLQVAGSSFRTVIATGGIATGLDVARAVALGATACGMARPLLQALDEGGVAGATSRLESIKRELSTAQLLTGCRTIGQLRQTPKILGADLLAWRDV